MAGLDPEEARAIIDPALKIMVDAVRRYNGYVVQSTGDGIFALFGAPAAYEDHPQRSIYAALQMRHELHEYAQRLADQGRPAVEFRIGINTGEVVVRTVETGGKVEYTPIGHTTNLASRLETAAPAGSIAVSEQTRSLVEGYFDLRALGPLPIRGINQPVNVYEVTELGPLRTHFQLSIQRGLTKFVGRERELAEMLRALELAMSGRGQIVAVVAEAGTGKSRLFYEFKATLPSECEVLEAYSVSHGQASPWLPVLELLHRYVGIDGADDQSARREKVQAKLTTLDPALTDILPYLFGLLGIVDGPDPLAHVDPQIKRRRTFDAIKAILLREAFKQPLVVIFEDLHWIDEQTQALLDLLADSIANSGILLLFNYRPEYRHAWTNKSYYSQLRLDPLSGADGSVMLAALLGESVELDPLKRLIVERTGGNPFFIEEIVQALFDEGTLVRNSGVKVARSLSQLRLPPNVQGILASRIDWLSAAQKDLLQTLAVIGRESRLALLRSVSGMPEGHLEEALRTLRAGEFVYEQPAAGDMEYIFKHALTQEVAYNSLLIERRKQLHERVGVAIETILSAQIDDHLSQLAHHYRYGNNVGKAIEYLGRAGQQASRRAAYRDAVVQFRLALQMVGGLSLTDVRDAVELTMLNGLLHGLFALKGPGHEELPELLNRAIVLCKKTAQDADLARALGALAGHYSYVGDMPRADQIGAEALDVARRTNKPRWVMLVHSQWATARYHMGLFPALRADLERALEHYSPQGSEEKDINQLPADVADVRSGVLLILSRALWMLGLCDQARKRSLEFLELSKLQRDPVALATANAFGSDVHYYCGEVDAVHERVKAVQRLLETMESEYPQLIGWTRMLEGWVIAEGGQPQEGLGVTREGYELILASGQRIAIPIFGCLMADILSRVGQVDTALETINRTAKAAEETSQHYFGSELRRLRGEFLLMRGHRDAPEAEGCFRTAIEIARRRSAKSWELRATTSLARLFAKQGRREEGRAMLTHIYKWFTEGFDTADLKDARALLDELAT